MPSRERVEAFVARVEQDAFVEAMQAFYSDDAIAQENGDPPRVGLENLIAHERAALARVKIHTMAGSWFMVDGDRVVMPLTKEFAQHFDLTEVLLDASSLVIQYRGPRGQSAEVLWFDAKKKVCRAAAHYAG